MLKLNEIHKDEKIQKGEFRVEFEGARKMSITKYDEVKIDIDPISTIRIEEFLIQGSTVYDEFIRWISKNCGKNATVNITEDTMSYVMASIVE